MQHTCMEFEKSCNDNESGSCVQVCLTQHAHMEIEESSGDDDGSGMSEDNTWMKDEEEACTASKCLEVL